MAIKAVAYSYWRRIKDGARTYASVPESVSADVKALAQLDVDNGVITSEEYTALIGDEYVSETNEKAAAYDILMGVSE